MVKVLVLGMMLSPDLVKRAAWTDSAEEPGVGVAFATHHEPSSSLEQMDSRMAGTT